MKFSWGLSPELSIGSDPFTPTASWQNRRIMKGCVNTAVFRRNAKRPVFKDLRGPHRFELLQIFSSCLRRAIITASARLDAPNFLNITMTWRFAASVVIP